MTPEEWLLIVAVSFMFVCGAFLIGRCWGYVDGRRARGQDMDRRLRAREAYLEQRLQEYAGMLEAVVSENQRLTSEVVADPADWWKTGQAPPESKF
jgi:hypothetical protein